MSDRRQKWLTAFASTLSIFITLGGTSALARIGGGEHFQSDSGDSGGDGGELIELLVWLIIQHPAVGLPMALIALGIYIYWQKQHQGDRSTRKALSHADDERRAHFGAGASEQWVAALKVKDPQFDLPSFFARVTKQFTELQDAWFERNLEGVRKYLSDASFQRLVTQLRLLELLGVRDAIAEPQVLNLKLVGLERNDHFDALHVQVTAQIRDADAPASASDDEAHALALRQSPERFIEVWTYVRKHDAQTKVENDVSQHKCPNCGAPFHGGATNTCEFCQAIVNSGSYDWVLAEITQDSQFHARAPPPDGLVKLRKRDPALAPEIVEDRAALLFWKWVEAQALADATRLAKVATAAFLQQLPSGHPRLLAECALGAVNTLQFDETGGTETATIELRWSAKGIGPQRQVMTLSRKVGAQTSAQNGMSTSRCPQCGAPLSDNGQPSCEFCGTQLSSGERDWVLAELHSWERWRSRPSSPSPRAAPATVKVPDQHERERLLYLMAALARADGEVDEAERKLLKIAAKRWGIAWANVELAMNASADALFDRLLSKGSPEAEAFLRELVQIAMADGKVDARERALLELAAGHLQLKDRLNGFLSAS